jgi:hypothetical protein
MPNPTVSFPQQDQNCANEPTPTSTTTLRVPESVTTLTTSVPATDSAKSKPKTPLKRTFRLTEIPTTVNEKQLKNYLNRLECKPGRCTTANILKLVLAPYLDWLVATVTFREEPLAFKPCQSGHTMKLPLPAELAEEGETTISVDCDFYGITPLYHPPGTLKPTFECVIQAPRHGSETDQRLIVSSPYLDFLHTRSVHGSRL